MGADTAPPLPARARRMALLRSVQSHFPFVRAAKFEAYNFATRMFGLHMIPEFRVLSGLAPVGLALDIGANWGQSLCAIQRTARPREVVCFEPSSFLSSRLQRRHAGDPAVRIEACALSDSEGTFELHTPRYRNYVYDGLASLDRAEAEEWLSPRRLKGFDPALQSVLSETVAVRQLDDYGFSPDVVKIDVQGAELAVVKGGIETFRRCRPACIIETPGEELVALLADLGLKAYHFDGQKLSTHDWAKFPNVVFLTDQHRERIGL